jgi:hypothetical protein
MSDYYDSLRDPRWAGPDGLKNRVLRRDKSKCRDCGAETIIVHHCAYLSGKAWDTPPETLIPTCDNGCHAFRNQTEADQRLELARIHAMLQGQEQQETFRKFFMNFLKNAAERLGLQPLPPTPPPIEP